MNAASASAVNRDPLEPEIQTAALQLPVPTQIAERPRLPYTTTDAIFASWTPAASLQAERMNSIAFLTLSTALVISIYGYAMHGAEGVQLLTGLLTGWMKNGVPYLP